MLSSSDESATIQRDLEQILIAPFAREHLTSPQRQSLETMFSTLMGAELDVQGAYMRWTASFGACSPGPRTGSMRGCCPCRRWRSKRRPSG